MSKSSNLFHIQAANTTHLTWLSLSWVEHNENPWMSVWWHLSPSGQLWLNQIPQSGIMGKWSLISIALFPSIDHSNHFATLAAFTYLYTHPYTDGGTNCSSGAIWGSGSCSRTLGRAAQSPQLQNVKLKAKAADLGASSRHNNVSIIGFPESIDGPTSRLVEVRLSSVEEAKRYLPSKC